MVRMGPTTVFTIQEDGGAGRDFRSHKGDSGFKNPTHGQTPVKSTVRSVRQISFIQGTNEIALGRDSLTRAIATS